MTHNDLRIIPIQILLFMFVFQYILAEEHWVSCRGEAAIQNITQEEAEHIAKRRARLDAIEKVCGVQIHSETLVNDFVMAGDFIHAFSSGEVVEEKDIQWQTETLPPENPASPPTVLLRLTMMAKVAVSEDQPDPSFKVDCKMNRTTFQSGDEVIFTIKPTKDCYVHIFNLAANDSVYILFPNNNFVTSNYIEAGKMVQIPGKSDIESNRSIRVSVLPGHKQDTEVVKIVATKSPVQFVEDFQVLNGFGLIGTPRVAVQQIARWLSQIPLSERAEETIVYTVNAK